MTNYSDTQVKCIGSEKEINELYRIMRELETKPRPDTANDWGRQWLGCLVQALGSDWQQVRCRGEWFDLELDGNILSFSTSSAWTAPTEVFNLIQEKFPNIEVFYSSVELGCCYAETNDVEGRFFTSRYIIDLSTEDEEYRTEYFDTLHDALSWTEKMMDCRLETEQDIEVLNDKLSVKDTEAYVYIHEFDVI